MKRAITAFAICSICAGTWQALAQGPGFTLSAGANYNLTQAPDASVQIRFSEFVENKFKTYDVLSESAFEFRGRPGAHLAAGVQWRLTPSLLIGTGLGLQYSAYDLQPNFTGYRPAPGGSDTVFMPLVLTQLPCDEIVFPENFNPNTNPGYRHEMLQMHIPLELRLRPGKGRVEIAAGLWGALPAWTRISKETVSIERRYTNSSQGVATSTCVYSKGISRESTGDGIRNLLWGVRGELNFRFTPAVSMFAGYQLSMANLYDEDSKPLLMGRRIDGIDTRQHVFQLGMRYLWEPAAPETEDDGLGKLNKATHKQMFKKKSKNAYKKKKYRRRR